MADLFRRIGLDERVHMEESMLEYERGLKDIFMVRIIYMVA
jgi:hypothetical protein